MKKAFSRHIALVILALAALGASGFAYWFMYQAAVRSAVSAANAAAAASGSEQASAEAANLEKAYAETADSRARLASFVITKDGIVSFIKRIEAVGKDSGSVVSLSSISSAPASDGGRSYIKGEISVAGSWPSVMRAVRMIEDLPYAISIGSLRLLSSGGRWNASLSVSALSSGAN